MAFQGAVVLAVLVTVAGAGAYLFLMGNATSIPGGLASDSSCPGSGSRQDTPTPLPSPMWTADVVVRDGESFTIDMPKGFWAAHLVSDEAAFAPHYHERAERPTLADGSPMPWAPPPMRGPVHWTSEFLQGWCFGEDHVGVFVAQGNGTVRVGYFAAEDAGMSLM